MKLIEWDSPMIQGFERIRDMVILNVLTLLCCLPIVTIGASLTAMHYMCIKMVRNEEGYIAKGFFHSFRENLKQATGIWIGLIALVAFIIADFYAVFHVNVWFIGIAKITLIVLTVVVVFAGTFIFPILSKFSGTTKQLVWNAVKLSFVKWPKTLLMMVVNLLPLVICYFVNMLIPLLLFFGFVVSGMINAKLYNKVFEQMEAPYIEKVEPSRFDVMEEA